MSQYAEFIRHKLAMQPSTGLTGEIALPDFLFPHQRALCQWALRRGRAAIFADTGLGKSPMELVWADQVARETCRPVLILAPLAVAAQTASLGMLWGIEARQCRDGSETDGARIVITNYDRVHRFDPSRFAGVVLDESSIIKHSDARTFSTLTAAFRHTPFRLCATATPAPNDWTELGTHAEFLGVCSKAEMLAEFFTHDGGNTAIWRLKGHAREVFWRWVSRWGAMVRRPSDLGFDDAAYALPPLHMHEHVADTEMPTDGMLFAREAQTLNDRRAARRMSLSDRVADCAALVNSTPGPWVVWCDLNAEADALRASIPGAVEIRGSDDADTKEKRLIDFSDGRISTLITKPSIAGFGLNWQHCCHMAFVGVTDSYEAFYQAVRRCWRFGQTRDVHVHTFASQAEGAVVANLKRKETDAARMAESLSAETRDAVMREMTGQTRQTNAHRADRPVGIPSFLRAAA